MYAVLLGGPSGGGGGGGGVLGLLHKRRRRGGQGGGCGGGREGTLRGGVGLRHESGADGHGAAGGGGEAAAGARVLGAKPAVRWRKGEPEGAREIGLGEEGFASFFFFSFSFPLFDF